MGRKDNRKKNLREVPPDLILIITEGVKTEPNYFKAFRVHNIDVEIIGTGRNTVSLVEEAKQLAEEKKEARAREFGIRVKDVTMTVWCVFDKDSFPSGNFNGAIQAAEGQGFKIAYSNEAFELWYLLHFNYYNTGITREQYIEKLSDLLEFKYEKNDEFMYNVLFENQWKAIQNAKKLLACYCSENPNANNPSTTVYKLVEYLNEFIIKRECP